MNCTLVLQSGVLRDLFFVAPSFDLKQSQLKKENNIHTVKLRAVDQSTIQF